MTRHTFSCLDGHTCGNPVRLVTDGAPDLRGTSMSEKRADFLANHDWIRTALMFEPRGHDMMSGGFIYPPCSDNADASILFIETSGCLPMCGHGTIGMVTFALENNLINPQTPGEIILDVPAGQIRITYEMEDDYVKSVRIFNIPSYLALEKLTVDCPELGMISIDVSYGGNFYAIVEAQENYTGLENMSAADILRISPKLRNRVNEMISVEHPEDATIKGVSHILWTGAPQTNGADARNAVFYGEKAIDRSPCGTGTSARMAQLAAKGKLAVGDTFVHESYIGSLFKGRIESKTKVGDYDAIVPSISGWAIQTGINKISIDDRDPFKHGFQVI